VRGFVFDMETGLLSEVDAVASEVDAVVLQTAG
jgi:hypothetical protein